MGKIRSKIQSIKDYFAERARLRAVRKNCDFLIRTEMMEASVRSYIRELEGKVEAQGKVIRLQARQIQDAEYGRIDRELDEVETAERNARHRRRFLATDAGAWG